MQALRPLRLYADFSGRSNRAEYWQWILLTMIVSAIARALDHASTSPYAAPRHTLTFLVGALTITPNLAVVVRRLHDRGQSWRPFGLCIAAVSMIACFAYSDPFPDYSAPGGSTLRAVVFGLAITFAGSLLFVLYQLVMPGDPDTNQFGPPPIDGLLSSDAGERRAPAPVRPPNSVADELERLAALRAQGVITDAEFDAQKRKLLGSGEQPGSQPPMPYQTGTQPAESIAKATSSQAAPLDAMPTPLLSRIWQERFAFHDTHGLTNSKELRQAYRSLPYWTRSRFAFSSLAFFLGPIYFIYLGIWRPAISLIVLIVLGSIALDQILGTLDPNIVNSTEHQAASAGGGGALFATTCIPLYYLKVREGIDTWNPFRRRV